MPIQGRLDRSFQTDARAKPVRPDSGTASGAAVRVAALYDVHGNLPALEAVLAELEGDLIVVGGDVVRGAFPAETVERLRGLGERACWLRGNAKREVVEMPPPREAGPPPGELERLRAALTDEQLTFLYSLPERIEPEVYGLGHVLFCHATPQNTHVQDDRSVGRARWVNAGSVGMPYEDARCVLGAPRPGRGAEAHGVRRRRVAAGVAPRGGRIFREPRP